MDLDVYSNFNASRVNRDVVSCTVTIGHTQSKAISTSIRPYIFGSLVEILDTDFVFIEVPNTEITAEELVNYFIEKFGKKITNSIKIRGKYE